MSLKHNLFLMTSGLALALASSPAFAQDLEDEIIATGLRQAYQGDFTILEIPGAELDLDQQILEDLNVTDLVTALDLSA